MCRQPFKGSSPWREPRACSSRRRRRQQARGQDLRAPPDSVRFVRAARRAGTGPRSIPARRRICTKGNPKMARRDLYSNPHPSHLSRAGNGAHGRAEAQGQLHPGHRVASVPVRWPTIVLRLTRRPRPAKCRPRAFVEWPKVQPLSTAERWAAGAARAQGSLPPTRPPARAGLRSPRAPWTDAMAAERATSERRRRRERVAATLQPAPSRCPR